MFFVLCDHKKYVSFFIYIRQNRKVFCVARYTYDYAGSTLPVQLEELLFLRVKKKDRCLTVQTRKLLMGVKKTRITELAGLDG